MTVLPVGSRTTGRDTAPEPAVPRIRPLPEGPVLVDGPADIVMPDGSVVRCERPVMALCTCRRSLRAPFCDTSHRTRLRRDRATKPRTQGGDPTTEVRTPDGPATEAGTPDGRATEARTLDGPVTETRTPDGPATEAGTPDGPVTEVGTPDGPVTEVGTPDGPVTEVGTPDGPVTEAGTPDGPVTEARTS
ncbi:CDGSH iron-sulfur domain-containing protein [Streptomyces venezuelae]|uniref:CDGSH iron-sulfur domain-containing protein n=1 Tax=Streptomyces venezuelae TaxID=54571 RepID=UPI0037CF468A